MDNGTFALRQQLQKLYQDHHGWLCELLRRKLGNAVDAADLAHDIYLHLMNKGQVPTAEQSRCHLTQIANGKVIDLYRRRQRETRYLEDHGLQPEPRVPSEEARALVVEALGAIDSALQRHSPKARQALLLCRLDGMAHRAIAAELRVSVSSVEKYIAAGVRTCRRYRIGSGA
ncbi:sigma-70 family RNA polymerase sigma factor [Pseudomonas soli]|uniref:Sigma-70 family RNA polymerase sigma factor n=1 Tax=Pseudomonas soli TaxID=1306993 RepID=A0ABU7GP40_9PSED|nr:sigma-70 family RNA polymerase sigma factor [Pseudomonas soli]MEE1880720.1 sigma-70 family RNA polymerase sigma factor [Pseudomonas soli]